MSYFNAIKLSGWRQFEDVELDLSKRVTIITGTNGCGKTTILTLLSRHFGWNIQFASTPYVSKRAAKRLYRDVHARSERSKRRACSRIQRNRYRAVMTKEILKLILAK